VSTACPICGGRGRPRFRLPAAGTELGVDADAFRPSSERFGAVSGTVQRCERCRHGWVADPPEPEDVSGAYADAADPVSLREEAGQMETARRALLAVEEVVTPGRMVDVGCWTGSFLAAARQRGWDPVGLEPSKWAADRAAERGLDVRVAELGDDGLEAGSCRLVVLCDVLEHLIDPRAALDRSATLLEPGGALFLTVPDAGSVLARLLGRRWWSVLPMHLQYFTRRSLGQLLTDSGFTVRSVRTHAKVFTARYYAERLGGYSDPAGRAAVRVAEAVRLADRLVAPDLRDRLAVIATRPR